ncbi:MAG: 1-deoxy-D-xylulose-5-phosphate synthase [Saccharofermentanales bacterium]
MSIIDEKLNEPDDIAKLDKDELIQLSVELRDEIISVVSKNGGHLSSNLGVIELTIALMRQFDFCKDRIIWDVGHQTYAYKILTGRYKNFCTLRQRNGLSGFPKRCESKYDAFNTGHSSTSISAALGMLRAGHIKGINNRVIAVIGDGALTGGMALEALNDAGQSGLDLIVILNDNQMSITHNVGGMSKHLEQIRVSKRYLKIKNRAYNILNKTKTGVFIANRIEDMKTIFRLLIRPKKVIFEDLGYKYYGPIDGHDIEELERHLNAVKKMKGPILLHVLTQKGKGYGFAENEPAKYHGVAPFEIANGISHPKKSLPDTPGYTTFSQAFGEFIVEHAKNDSSIVAVCAAMSSATGLDRFQSAFPKRIFDVGIAEQHAITMAAGMAAEGMKPVIAIYSTFLQRGYDQLLHDIALQKLHVVLCIDRAGIVGEDGETHQGIYDLSLLMTIPSITILSPRNYIELKQMLKYALYNCKGPVAIRYPRGSEKELPEGFDIIDDPKNIPAPLLLRDGKDITIITEGIMAEKGALACMGLEKAGYSCDLIDIRKIKPLEEQIILESIIKTGKVITVENAIKTGGVGSLIESLVLRNKIDASVDKIGVDDHPLCQGKIEELFKQEDMDSDSIYKKAIQILTR